ncbi:hypothetical protein II906_00980, partial [bacterium]|nr:hypothetical protein [bacterium]
MAIEGFDYKGFAANLTKQAMEILSQEGNNAFPTSLSAADKKILVETVNRFCLMAGEALNNEQNIKLNASQASLITQFIGEWTFHKSIDLINGGVSAEHRGPILQAIAGNIYSTAQLAMVKKLPDEALVSLIEEKVNSVYKEELDKLLKRGVLSPEQADKA